MRIWSAATVEDTRCPNATALVALEGGISRDKDVAASCVGGFGLVAGAVEEDVGDGRSVETMGDDGATGSRRGA